MPKYWWNMRSAHQYNQANFQKVDKFWTLYKCFIYFILTLSTFSYLRVFTLKLKKKKSSNITRKQQCIWVSRIRKKVSYKRFNIHQLIWRWGIQILYKCIYSNNLLTFLDTFLHTSLHMSKEKIRYIYTHVIYIYDIRSTDRQSYKYFDFLILMFFIWFPINLFSSNVKKKLLTAKGSFPSLYIYYYDDEFFFFFLPVCLSVNNKKLRKIKSFIRVFLL